MKKKVIILGSTGSVGKKTFNIFCKHKKDFQVVLLSTNKNISEIVKQSKIFNVKNLIVTDKDKYNEARIKYSKLNIHFYNSFDVIGKIFKNKEIHYSMVSIVGINGLSPSLSLIHKSQNIAIVNKESLICGWKIIKKKLILHNTNFIPIDSEHYSLFSLLDNKNKCFINNIYITSSGGPFLNYSNLFKKKITIKKALNHPTWLMGKKISIDSSTLMNKVFEVIEAKNIFDLTYNKIKILTHPKSYVHAIIKFNNGMIKFVAHSPDMKIPIYNSIFKEEISFKNKTLNLDILNNLLFKPVDLKQFPLCKILKYMPEDNSLYETALITINDYYVNLFLNRRISYQNMINMILKISLSKDILKYRKVSVKNLNQIMNFHKYVSLKLDNLVYKF